MRLMRGTRAKVDALALARGLVDGTPIFITDEQRYAVATGVNSYRVFKRGGIQFAASTQNDSGVANTPIVWSATAVNDGGGFDGTTFVAPLSGLYMLTCSVLIRSNAPLAGYIVDIYKVGGADGSSIAAYCTKTVANYMSIVASGAMWLDAGQSVHARLQGGDNVFFFSTADAQRYNKFSGFLID